MEEWKIIDGFENYAVSNLGNIKNVKFGRLVKTFLDKDGYLLVNLYSSGKMKTHKVHRLVLSAFVENTENKEQVNHINGDKQDNLIENLEWSTQSENQCHRRKVLGKTGGGLQRKRVMCVETQKDYESIMQAERETGICHQHIGKCLLGKRKSAGGAHWALVS